MLGFSAAVGMPGGSAPGRHNATFLANFTPLECAARHGHVYAIALLVGAGAQPRGAFMAAEGFGATHALLEGIALAAKGGFLRPQQTFAPGKAPPPRPPSAQQRHAPTAAKAAGAGASVGRAASGGGGVERPKSSKQGKQAPLAPSQRAAPPRAGAAEPMAAAGGGAAPTAWVGDLIADPYEQSDGQAGIAPRPLMQTICAGLRPGAAHPHTEVLCADVAAGRYARALRELVRALAGDLGGTHPDDARALVHATLAAAAAEPDRELRDLLNGTDDEVRQRGGGRGRGVAMLALGTWGEGSRRCDAGTYPCAAENTHSRRAHAPAPLHAPRTLTLYRPRGVGPPLPLPSRAGLHGDLSPRVRRARPRAQAAARGGGGGRRKQTAARGALRVSAALARVLCGPPLPRFFFVCLPPTSAHKSKVPSC